MQENFPQVLKEESRKDTLGLCGEMTSIELGRQELRGQNCQR